MWEAFISIIPGAGKLLETIWKNRTRLATTYYFTGQAGESDEITIVNLSAAAVQVSHYALKWKPNLFRWKTSIIDVNLDELNSTFTIPPKGSYTLHFGEGSNFDWSYQSALHRQLYLTLHIFGQRPKVLKVGAGQ